MYKVVLQLQPFNTASLTSSFDGAGDTFHLRIVSDPLASTNDRDLMFSVPLSLFEHAGDTFHLRIVFSERYPLEPPEVRHIFCWECALHSLQWNRHPLEPPDVGLFAAA